MVVMEQRLSRFGHFGYWSWVQRAVNGSESLTPLHTQCYGANRRDSQQIAGN
jgi:hypothetical protein